MKQTAVEWLIETISYKDKLGKTSINIHPDCDISNEIKIAKQMEKQQVDDAFEDGYQSGYKDNGISGEQYYNDTFKK
jgi:hypothetical protein